jgi:hypothetical protein
MFVLQKTYVRRLIRRTDSPHWERVLAGRTGTDFNDFNASHQTANLGFRVQFASFCVKAFLCSQLSYERGTVS